MSDKANGGGNGPIGSVLVVEDNMLIALDTEDALLRAGVTEVTIVGSCQAALAELAKGKTGFALLDFNLGSETSEPVAEALIAQGVPFCYATGYGDALADIELQPPCGVLKKPYSHQDIADVLERARAG